MRALPLHLVMPLLVRRTFGLFLLTLAIAIPSCQAVFPRDANPPRPFNPGFVNE